MVDIFFRIERPNCIITYQVNALYLLVAISVSSLVISYGLTKFIIHQLNSKSAQPHINRGGDTNPKEIIAANAIIACVADNTMLKNPSLINVIFSNLKENIRDTSLTTAPTLIRVIADSVLKLKRAQSQPMIFNVRNTLAIITTSHIREVINKAVRALTVGTIRGLTLAYTMVNTNLHAVFASNRISIFITLVIWDLTKNCSYNCQDYVHQLPNNNQPIEIYSQFSDAGHSILTDKNPNLVEFYLPSFEQQKEKQYVANINTEKCKDVTIESGITIKSNKNLNQINFETPNQCLEIKSAAEHQTAKVFKRSKKKAKQVNFSDFKKTDPILSQYNNVEENYVPHNSSKLKKIRERNQAKTQEKIKNQKTNLNDKWEKTKKELEKLDDYIQ